MQEHLKGASNISIDVYREVADNDKYVTIVAYNKDHDKISDLCKATEETKGLDEVLKSYEKARRIKASYILVYELKNPKSPISRPSSKYQIEIENILPPELPKDEEIKHNFETPDYSQYNEQFQGLGGLSGLMEAKENLYKKDFEVKKLTFENLRLIEEKQNLKKEVEDYEEENAKLEEANLRLIDELEPYRAKDPRNAKVFGFDLTGLLGAAVERGAKNLIIKNPISAKTILGLDDGQLNGFLSELKGENIATERQIDTNVQTDIEFEDEEDTSKLTEQQKGHLQVSKQIYEWLKTISTDDLYKIATILEVFQKDMSKTNEVLKFINH